VRLWGTPISPWQQTGPVTTSAVGPASTVPGTEAYAYRGAANRLYWHVGMSVNLGWVITSAPDTLAATQPDTGDPLTMIVARGADNALWMNTNGTWRSLGGKAS
jgi:hypothetical protein